MAKPDHVIVKEADPVGYFDPECTYYIECLTKGGCGGYMECLEDHSEAHYARDDIHWIHGRVHRRVNGVWVVPFHNCLVKLTDWDVPERIYSEATPPGRYPVLAVWDDYEVTLEEQDNG